jgi:hypothetical protein
MDMDKICKRVIKHYGVINQLNKACEEINELKNEIDVPSDKQNKQRIVDEIADVSIMVYQIILITENIIRDFDINEDGIDTRVDFKLSRLERRMDGLE